MRDGRLLSAVKRVARWRFHVDVFVQRALLRSRRQVHWTLGGDCQRCARCCEAPGIQVGRLVWYVPVLRSAFLSWQRRVNGFELVERDVAARVFVFRCSHFDRESRSCDSYDSRPGMCRDYPRNLLDQPSPEFLPGCGYRAIAANGERLIRVLQRADLTQAQRERLKKDLRLE